MEMIVWISNDSLSRGPGRHYLCEFSTFSNASVSVFVFCEKLTAHEENCGVGVPIKLEFRG